VRIEEKENCPGEPWEKWRKWPRVGFSIPNSFLIPGLFKFKTDSNLNEFYSEIKPETLNNSKQNARGMKMEQIVI
jgi:hypothetical protein